MIFRGALTGAGMVAACSLCMVEGVGSGWGGKWVWVGSVLPFFSFNSAVAALAMPFFFLFLFFFLS